MSSFKITCVNQETRGYDSKISYSRIINPKQQQQQLHSGSLPFVDISSLKIIIKTATLNWKWTRQSIRIVKSIRV